MPAADAWWENTDYKSDGTWICPGQFVLAATIEYFEDEDVNLFKKETALSTLALLFFLKEKWRKIVIKDRYWSFESALPL